MLDRNRPLYMLRMSVLPGSGLGRLISSGHHSSPVDLCRSLPACWKHTTLQIHFQKCDCNAGILAQLTKTKGCTHIHHLLHGMAVR